MKRPIIFCICMTIALSGAGGFAVDAARAAGTIDAVSTASTTETQNTATGTLSHSRIIITEIMYDAPGTDSGREWIEVENIGAAPIDLSAWRLFEADTNHKITAVASASPDLPSGGFAVIADSPDKFLADNPGYVGLLFDSAFSLGNGGETLALRDEALADSDSVTYQPSLGAAGDGNTLQRAAGGDWISAHPTPGSATTATVSEAPLAPPQTNAAAMSQNDLGTGAGGDTTSGMNAGNGGGISTHDSQVPATISYSPPEFEISAGRPRLGFVGAPLSFNAQVVRSTDIALGTSIQSSWSMGDGTEIFGAAVRHAYEFPGTYSVVVNSDSGGAHAVARVEVHIVPAQLSLSVSVPGISAVSPGYIEVSNIGETEVNLGGFILEDAGSRFIIPEDTIIGARSSIKLSSTVTGIASPREFVRIAAPVGNIIASIPVTLLAEPTIALPPGMTADVVRARFESALKIYNPSSKMI